MSGSQKEEGSQLARDDQMRKERPVYVLPEQAFSRMTEDEINLRDLWNIVLRDRRIIIVVTLVFTLATAVYALLATEWYRAEALLSPAEERSTPSLGGFGGLAALAGVSVGGGGNADSVAVLESREFARDFIDDLNLLPVFFAEDWNAENQSWRDDDPEQWPDLRDGATYFHENVLRVSEDEATGLVQLAISWKDPEAAAAWAGGLVQRLNTRIRERELETAEANVAYLQEELAKTNVLTLQQSISSLLENELKKLMLARGNEEFVFWVVDHPVPPKEHTHPKRALVIGLGTLLGGVLSVLGVFLRHAVRSSLELPHSGHENEKNA